MKSPHPGPLYALGVTVGQGLGVDIGISQGKVLRGMSTRATLGPLVGAVMTRMGEQT